MPSKTSTFSQVNNVSCRNINVIAKYVNSKIGSDLLLTANLSHPAEYLLNEHNWIPLSLYNEIMDRAITLLNDPLAPYKIGLSAMELESWGLFKYIRKIFLTLVIDPIIVYKKVSEYNPLFNNTKDFHLISGSKTHCVFKIKFRDDVNPVDDFHSDRYIQGILASIPQIWNLPSSAVKSVSHEYDLLDLLHRRGNVQRHEMEFLDDVLYIQGKEVGRRIGTYKNNSWKNILSEKHGVVDPVVFESLETAEKGVLITKDFKANDFVFLREGEIYSAPHFIYYISWEKPSLMANVKHLFLQSWRSRITYENAIVASLSTMKDYTSTLEQKVIERTQELESARAESEYWRKKADHLLSTMLPEHIAKEMIEKELESQEVYGTVLYTDIVGFTEYSQNNTRAGVDNELKLYFAEITNIVTRHGGWVNKFLGDGMLVIFGLNGGTSSSVEDATLAAKQIVENIGKYSWGTRVSITTGPFTIGEYGNGELRRFDCVGHTLNLGSRLQAFAETNQIIVCDKTYEALLHSNHLFGKERDLEVKGIGNVRAYPLLIPVSAPIISVP